ncbi:MAG: histidine--tRNA ligase [Planctomycetes bacterium]|nr:histidine--tRNA ligase [Planctomycetota bacterium]
MISPKIPSGFRDYLPAEALARQRSIDAVVGVYRSFGYLPIDTPAVEYLEVLQGKGGDESDRQIFRIQPGREGKEETGLRFDLTVPLARFVAQHQNELEFPFRRYHVGPVWRGEKAQVKRGRFREFLQCDFDLLGVASVAADAEAALVIAAAMTALGAPGFCIHVNNRHLLAGLLERQGAAGHAAHVLRSIDKLSKIGREAVLEELQFGPRPNVELQRTDPAEYQRRCDARERLMAEATAAAILDFLTIDAGSNDATLALAAERVKGSPRGERGVAELARLLEIFAGAGAPAERLVVDVALARGLDYYTGTVYETMVEGCAEFGSVCSGGRYDDLAGLFTERRLPGVGASIGLDRLLAVLAHAGAPGKAGPAADALIVMFDERFAPLYAKMAADLRAAGLVVEVYPEAAPVKRQFAYASQRGHRVAVVVGEDEVKAGTVTLKNLVARAESKGHAPGDLAAAVRAMIAAG